MLELTFGEQVKIILSRKGMTIKELAEKIEKQTGKKMSRQNLTQRLGRDNFQEQDMRMIAKILECPFYLDILEEHEDRTEKPVKEQKAAEPEQKEAPTRAEERDITIGELVDIHKELDAIEKKKSKKKAKKVKEIILTAREYQLLEYLMYNQGNVLTKENILEYVWGLDGQFVVDNTVSVTINRLRKKIETDAGSPIYLKNVFGLGYKLECV